MSRKKLNIAGEVCVIPVESIDRKIYFIREQKVMLDSELASLYEVETKYLVRAVKRNKDRFPSDFAFQLSDEEVTALRCQLAPQNQAEEDVGMRHGYLLSTVYSCFLAFFEVSAPALVNVQIMRSFVKLREMVASHEYLLQRLDDLEERYDRNFREVFKTLRELIEAPLSKKNPIGFRMQDVEEG